MLPLDAPIEPMLARAVRDLDAVPAEGVTWEPKLDGFRCLVWRDGPDLVLQGRSGRSLEGWFPELVGPLRAALPSRVVLDGELVVPVDGRLDLDALQARIHPAPSRVERLSAALPARFVAFDLLALGDRSLLEAPWQERRRLLDQVLSVTRAPLHRCPTSRDRADAQHWFARPVGGDLDGVVAKAVDEPYVPGARGWWKVKHRHTVDLVVGGVRPHRSGDPVGTLLLGLHDGGGTLQYVGTTRALAVASRRAAADALAGLPAIADEDHPWLGEVGGRVPGGSSRWRTEVADWTPVPPVLVVECEVEGLQGDRLRSGARLVRWRDDRTADSCRFDQLRTGGAGGPIDGLRWVDA